MGKNTELRDYVVGIVGELQDDRDSLEDAMQVWEWFEREEYEGVPDGQQPIPMAILETAIAIGMASGIDEEQRDMGWVGWVEQAVESQILLTYTEGMSDKDNDEAVERILKAIEQIIIEEQEV